MAGTDPSLHRKAWRLVRAAVLERDHHVCQINGPRCTHRATTVDHVVPRHEGGDRYDERNLRAACLSCNSAGGAQITNAIRAGRSVGVRSRTW